MAFSLKKFLEEATAQINPFDGGKTASTVRAQRQAPSPVPTRSAPRPTDNRSFLGKAYDHINLSDHGKSWSNPRVGMPSYGAGIAGFINNTRDVLDANTPQDYWQRNQQAMRGWKAPMQAPKLNQSYRDEQIALGNKRPYQNVGAAFVGNTARFANSFDAAVGEAVDTANVYAAQAQNNPELIQAANARLQRNQAKRFDPQGGLLGQGTIFDNKEDYLTSGALDTTKKVAANTAGTALEVAPFTKGAGLTANALSKASKPVQVVARTGMGFAEGVAQDALEQQFTRDNFSPTQALASGVFGGVMPNVAPAVGKALSNVPTTRLVSGAKNVLDDQGGFIQVGRTPKRVHPEDQNVMADFIDYQRGVYKPDPDTAYNLELDASRIAERYGMPMPNTTQKLANVFDKRLQQEGFGQPDMDVTQRLMLDYAKNPAVKPPSNSLTGDGALAPTSISAARRQELMANMRKPKLTTRLVQNTKALVKDEQGGIPFRPDEPQKPKGFILKETKGRGGRKDTVRVSKGADGKLQKTYQSEFDVKSADPYIREYADSLRQIDEGMTGGQMIPDGEGGYRRTSEHSKFYRDTFKEKGRKPTREEWYAEADRQVREGKADKDFMEYYNEMVTKRGTAPDNAKVLENRAPRRMSEAEWRSLSKQAEAEAPKSRDAVNAVTKDAKQEQLQAVSQGDFKRAQQIREKIGEVEQGLKRTPPDLNKRAEDIVPDFELKDIGGRSNKEIKQRFLERANQYLGERRAAEYRAVDEARIFNEQFGDLTDAQKLEVIRATDQPGYKSSDPRVQQAVEALHTRYDQAYVYYTQDKGMNMGYQHSYYPRMYKNPTTGDVISGAEFELLQRASSRQKGRTADMIAEDWLVTKDPAEALQLYHANLENAAAGRAFLADLEKEGLVVRSSEPVRGMRPVVAEGMQDSGTVFYAKPEVAKSLDRMFGTQEASGLFEKLVEKGQGLNSFIQSVVLSGGIPNTPVNAFGFMQVMKEAMGGHPIIAGKAFIGSMSRKNSYKFFKANSDILQEMTQNGYDIRIDYNAKYRNMFQRIGETGGKDGKLAGINEAWDQLTNDATFQRFMPILEVLHYKQIRKGWIRRNVAPEVAAKRAMDATSNFFGKTSMAKQAVRNKTGQDFVGATLVAPRFRESMINFWGRNVKALNPKNLGKAEYRANQMFMVSAAATWAAMEAANMALNGNWMHDNPDGKKDKLIIPDKYVPFDTGGKDIGLPFLSSIATVPRNAAQGAYNLATGKFNEAAKNAKAFVSMPLNTAMSVATNEDYFGNPIVEEDASAKDKFTQAGAYIARSNMQPWAREGLNKLGQGLPDDTKKALGIKEKGLAETISNALESPTRFYDPKYYRYDNGWTPRGKPGETFTITEQRERARVKKDMDNIPTNLGLSKKQKEAYEALITVDFDDEGNLKTDNDPFYRAKRATALQDDGVFEAMKQRAQYNNKLKGQPIDPLYNLPADARRVILWKQTLPAGTKDPTVSQIYNQEWYQDFRGEQDRYYQAKSKWNKQMGYKPGPKDTNPYPTPSKDLQAKLDYYYTLPKGTGARSAMLRNNPDILAHWDKTEAWTNGERAMVGLGPVDNDTTTSRYAYSGSSSRSGGRSGRRGGGSRSAKGKFDYKLDAFGKKQSSLRDDLLKLVAQAGGKSKVKIKKAKNIG